MKRLALVMVLGLVAIYLVPVLLPHLNRVPHHHILVGNVSAGDLNAHLEAERFEQKPSSAEHQLHSGFILSIPFGDFLNFFANLGMCILAAIVWIGAITFHTRVLIHVPLFTSPPLRLAVPPPRCV